MRALDGFTRFCSDTRARTAEMPVRWPVLLLAAAISAGFIGTGLSVTSPVSAAVGDHVAAPQVAALQVVQCRDQAWPYFTDNCLRRGSELQAPRTARIIPIVAQTADARAAAERIRKDDRPAPPQAKDRRKGSNR